MYKYPKLQKCIQCFHGEDCQKRGKNIPRKKKKMLKEIMHSPYIGSWHEMHDLPSSCDIGDFFREMNKDIFLWIPFFRKHKKALDKIIEEHCENEGVEWGIYMDKETPSKPEIFWFWDDYNGLYSYGGKMKAIYNPEEKDETWSFDETKSLISALGLGISNINNFVDLVKKINPERSLY